MAFLRHGCRVSAICPPGHPLRFVTGVEQLFLYKGLNSLGSLKACILAVQPDLIVPCDDGVVWQLHELHAQNAAQRTLIERSLGAREAYPIIRNRGTFLQAAAQLGIRVPATKTVTAEADVTAWDFQADAVLKRDGTWGGSGVIIVRSLPEALTAFRKLREPIGAGMAWKRWLVNCDPLAIWSWRRQEASSITMQEFIPGHPANAMIACCQGEVLGIISVEVLTTLGATGAALVVRLIQNEEIQEAAQRVARQLMLSGFYGLDFVLEQKTGAAYLIEINPRCTQLGHLRVPTRGDLAGAVSAKLRNELVQAMVPESRNLLPGDTVAFFPQAFKSNPHSPYLVNGSHDVPWEEPGLVLELLRDSWSERQWFSRIYHSFRDADHQEEVNYETS